MGCVAAMWREPIKAQRFEWTMTHCEPKAPHYLSYGPPTPCLPMAVLRALTALDRLLGAHRWLGAAEEPRVRL